MTTPLPDLGMTPTTTTPATMASAATRPVAGAVATATARGGGEFARLMNLQARGRALEAKLAQVPNSATDPALQAQSRQAKFTATKLKELRELVGSQPGSNARRALAALVERLEAGGATNDFRITETARIKLAIAADERRIDVAGAKQVRDAILSLDQTVDTLQKQTDDPTMVQDPARLAQFQQQNKYAQDKVERLESLLTGGRVDLSAVTNLFDVA